LFFPSLITKQPASSTHNYKQTGNQRTLINQLYLKLMQIGERSAARTECG